jgi:hypothetical protein
MIVIGHGFQGQSRRSMAITLDQLILRTVLDNAPRGHAGPTMMDTKKLSCGLDSEL